MFKKIHFIYMKEKEKKKRVRERERGGGQSLKSFILKSNEFYIYKIL